MGGYGRFVRGGCGFLAVLGVMLVARHHVAFAQERVSPPVILITDIDDTLQDTHLRRQNESGGVCGLVQSFFRFLLNLPKNHDAFTCAAPLYFSLARAGIPIFYVSGAIEDLSRLPHNFLQTSQFPAGGVFLRPDLKVSTFDHKVETIRSISRLHPEAEIILVGDNGEMDVEIYDTLKNDSMVGPRIRAVFIHELYLSPPGQTLRQGQRSYLTFFDLAAEFYDLGLIDDKTLAQIGAMTERGFYSEFDNVTERTLPKYVRLSEIQMTAWRDRLDKIPQPAKSYWTSCLRALEARGVKNN